MEHWLRRSLPYWSPQILGGIAAAGVLYLIVTGKAEAEIGGFAANGYAEHSPGGYNLMACLITEVVMTFACMRWILPKASLSKEANAKSKYDLTTLGLFLLSLILLTCRLFIFEREFIIHVSMLLIEFVWMIYAILLSLTTRLSAEKIARGISLYVQMIILDINYSGVMVVMGGLSMGIGFAMKETIVNLDQFGASSVDLAVAVWVPVRSKSSTLSSVRETI